MGWNWNLIFTAGELITPRRGHGSIYDGSRIIVVGGYGSPMKTEVCSLSDGTMDCKDQDPILTDYTYYPELFTIPDNFCK